MRFCPFCSAENPDEATHCGTCARKLPPLPPRRRKATQGDRRAASQPAATPPRDPAATGPADRATDHAASRAAPAPSSRAPRPKAKSDSLLSKVALGPAALRRSHDPATSRRPPAPRRQQRPNVAPEIRVRTAERTPYGSPITTPPPERPVSAPPVAAGMPSSGLVASPSGDSGEFASEPRSAPDPADTLVSDQIQIPETSSEFDDTRFDVTPAPEVRRSASDPGDLGDELADPPARTPPPRRRMRSRPVPTDDDGWGPPTGAQPELDPSFAPAEPDPAAQSDVPPDVHAGWPERSDPSAAAEWDKHVRRQAAQRRTPVAHPPPVVASPPELDRLSHAAPPIADPGARTITTPGPAPRPDAPSRGPDPFAPPPTRVYREHELSGFTPPDVLPIPEVPEPGFLNAVRYALQFVRARWQRRSAIKTLQEGIKEDTAALDVVLGTLGTQARALGVDNRVLSGENAAIDDAEQRLARVDQELAELGSRQAEENRKYDDIDADWQAKVRAASEALEAAQRELGSLEAQRRGLRDKRKTIERQQKGYLKAAEDRDEQAGKVAMGDARATLRRAAEDLRRDAAALDPERQDLERRLAALEKPISTAEAKVDKCKTAYDAHRRAQSDASEGHRHRLAEVEAEQGRKSRELSQAHAEIQRRLVTLGTLVNLHRVEQPEFDELYGQIDVLRGGIGARTTEIDRFTAERAAYDKASLIRGFAALASGVVLFIFVLVILFAIF